MLKKKLERAVSGGKGRERKTRRGEEEQKQKSTKTDLDRKKKGARERERERGREGGRQTEEAFVCKTAISEGEKGLGSADELM